MAHQLEQLANGQTAFASARMHAWHQLGTITDTTMTADEIMTKAFLGGWKVRKIPLQGVETASDGVNLIECPDRWMTVRSNIVDGRTEYLGVVGEEYTVVQNEEAAEMLDLLVDEAGGAHFETAGSLRKGKAIFVTMKLPTTMRIAGVDHLDLYLCASTSHDGLQALRVDAAPVRVVCANTQRAALAQSKGFYVFRHTSNIKAQIAQAREAMGLMWTYLDAFQAEAEKMINETMVMAEFEKVIAELWPLADDASETTRNNHKKRAATLRYLVRDADTQQPVKGTRWAGYQAITEYIDHFAPAKDPILRANRAVSGPAVELKNRAFELLSA
jgi:phage/plasmid-like protein (TIGR03299 family)